MAEQGYQTTITNPDLIGEAVDSGPAPEQEARQLAEPKPADKHGWWWGVGRRKTAVARVRLRPAQDGQPKVQIQINRKKFKTVEDYFSEAQDRADVHAPLGVTDTADKLEVFVRVDGGGITGQAQAIRLGIARALVGYDPHLENVLREKGYLTRDARKVERKKYGQPGARRRFQFSKR
jgi:small subunit ribosomal protein S9